jgi:hypothetical protein
MSQVKRLCARLWAWLWWRIKPLWRLLARASGPGLFLVFSAWQAVVIGRYFSDLGWHWCPAWPLAAVIGFTPVLGSLAAAKVAADVGWMGFWYALGIFLTPFWLFAFLTLFQVKFFRVFMRGPLRRLLPLQPPPPLRLLRVSKPWKPASARGT